MIRPSILTLLCVLAATATPASAAPPPKAHPKTAQPPPVVTGVAKPSCNGTATIRMGHVDLKMALARGDTNLGTSGESTIRATARFTKRRVIVDVEGMVSERFGDTLFRGFAQSSSGIADHPGCEIASISMNEGRLRVTKGGPSPATVQGTGLIKSARCETAWGNYYVHYCSAVALQDITVRFRPLVEDCSPVTVSIPHLVAWNEDLSGTVHTRPLDEIVPREYGIELGVGPHSVHIHTTARENTRNAGLVETQDPRPGDRQDRQHLDDQSVGE